MRLTVFNGSPRGKQSNTTVLLEHFLGGFTAKEGNSYEIAYLTPVKDEDRLVTLFQEAERVLLAFPLYGDAMPSGGKTFIEALSPLCGRAANPPLGFIVQSGLPEAFHSRGAERYLEKLARRLGSPYLGTAVKGGVEGIRAQPESWNRRLFRAFYELGEAFGETGEFDRGLLTRLAGTERFSRAQALNYRLIGRRLAHSFYWNKMLKENQAYEKRFDRPYLEPK